MLPQYLHVPAQCTLILKISSGGRRSVTVTWISKIPAHTSHQPHFHLAPVKNLSTPEGLAQNIDLGYEGFGGV